MGLSQRLHLWLVDLLCRLILHLNAAEVRAVANAWPHLTTAIEEPGRRDGRLAIMAGHAEAVRLAAGGKYDRTHPQRRLAVDLLLKGQCARIDKDGNLVREASTAEMTRRLDFWRDVELTRCILGTTKISAPVAAPVKKIVLPDDDHSPLDELPPWDGSGEDILADTKMEDEAVDTEGDGDDIDD